jgi:aminocarboxymuconate-semialdehyde decarboxylase
VLVFIHPQGDGAPEQLGHRFKGNGYLSNVIGNPLETTIALSHLIFEGTLASFPSLKICAAHAGGFLPSYAGRCDRGCPVRPDLCPGGTHGPIKKCPSEYLKQMYYDTMVFRPDGVRHLVAEVGASQLMVGTDYPYPWTTTAIDLIFEIPGLSDADSDRDPRWHGHPTAGHQGVGPVLSRVFRHGWTRLLTARLTECNLATA